MMKKDRSMVRDLPCGITSHWFTTDAGRLAALYARPAEGVTSRQAAVVFVNGYLGWKEDFLPVLSLLAQAGHHVYAYDHRGQHESDGPNGSAAYTIEALAADLVQIVPQLSGSDAVHLVGLCMGGAVARLAAARCTGVSTYTMVAATLGPGRLANTLRSARIAGRIVGARTVARAVLAHWERARPVRDADPAPWHGDRDRLRGTTADHLRGLARSWPKVEREHAHDAAPEMPALIVHGAKDRLFSAEEYLSAARVLGAEVTTVADAGHCVQLHQPKAFTQALMDFWARKAPGDDLRHDAVAAVAGADPACGRPSHAGADGL
ncbi:alpha/beta fold hydrolase [Streptomyces sp. NPDC054838]